MRAAYDRSLEACRERDQPGRKGVYPEVGWVGAVVGITFAYAVVRYVILGGTSPSQIPAFILNKAIAWSAVVLLGAAIASRSRETRRWSGLGGAVLSVLHLMLTVPLVSPAYYPKLFEIGAYTWSGLGQLALLTGALGLTGLAVVVWPSSLAPGSPRWVHRVPAAVVFVAALHCVALGAMGSWDPGSRGAWNPATWPAGLPSISLLAFATAAAALVVKRVRRLRW